MSSTGQAVAQVPPPPQHLPIPQGMAGNLGKEQDQGGSTCLFTQVGPSRTLQQDLGGMW